MNKVKGFLYVANAPRFKEEALISVKSLRRFNQEPVCIVCAPDLLDLEIENSFDIVIEEERLNDFTYLAKIIGMQLTPFDKTVFLDGDTFITDNISELFVILELVDFSTTQEKLLHTSMALSKNYKYVFPEFHTAVIAYKNNNVMKKVMEDWFNICQSNNIPIDMPGFREAVLKNFKSLKYSVLPDHYNTSGFRSMALLHHRVKIIHERLGYHKKSTTPKFESFEFMASFEKKINKLHTKRLYMPLIGIIPYNYNFHNLIRFIKRRIGYKKVYKSRRME